MANPLLPLPSQAAKSADSCKRPETNRKTSALPLLENGDRLTAVEFMRRYEAMPELRKAQLIEGTVFMPAPVRAPGRTFVEQKIKGGVLRSAVFPGLVLDVKALLRGDKARLVAALTPPVA